MKTQGLQVTEGFLVFPAWQVVPDQFWHRLKHALTKAGVIEDFRMDYRRENATVALERKLNGWTSSQRFAEFDRERDLFRRWVERVIGPQTLWPWQRGWTEELVDSYLEAKEARAA